LLDTIKIKGQSILSAFEIEDIDFTLSEF